MLGLRRQLELDDARLGICTGEHDDLGRSGRKVDGDVPRDEELRLVHVRATRPADLVDARDRRGSVGKRGDRRRAADRPNLVEAESSRRRRDPAGALGRRDDHDPLDARCPRRYRAHDERRDEPARHVDADRAERDPASLELDSRTHLEPDVARALELVPALDGVGELEQRLDWNLLGGLCPPGLDAVEPQRPLAERLVAA